MMRKFVSVLCPNTRCAGRGFTLFEMVIVMSIAAILTAIAIPSYQYVTTTNRIAAEINGLVGDLQFARAEAIKEGQSISVCVANTTSTGCLANNTAWNGGWIVFVDINSSGAVDAAGDKVLRIQPAFTSTDTFNASNSLAYITFNREGFAIGPGIAGGALITLHAVPPRQPSTRCLNINLVGLMQVLTNDGASYNGFTCT